MNSTFKKVCIIGLGLIGGSIGLAMKRSKISNQIIGFARSNSTLKRAIELGLVDKVKDNLEDAVNDCDLIILATPLSTFKKLVEEMNFVNIIFIQLYKNVGFEIFDLRGF